MAEVDVEGEMSLVCVGPRIRLDKDVYQGDLFGGESCVGKSGINQSDQEWT
jgi:hypothetical protein